MAPPRREQLPVGEVLWNGITVGTVNVLAIDENEKIFICSSATNPSAVAGYAIGCMLINTTTGILHLNLGSTTSCSFYAVYGASPSPSASLSPSSSKSPSASLSPSSSKSPSMSPSESPSNSPSLSPSSSNSPSESPSVSPS